MKVTNKLINNFKAKQDELGTGIAITDLLYEVSEELLKDLGVKNKIKNHEIDSKKI